MPLIRMELNPEAVLFLETECLPEEVEAFHVCARLIRRDPINHSDLWKGPTNSRYAIRSFRFGGCRAFFHYRMTGSRRTDLITVTTCKRIPFPKA